MVTFTFMSRVNECGDVCVRESVEPVLNSGDIREE